jgi:hypothetical protein
MDIPMLITRLVLSAQLLRSEDFSEAVEALYKRLRKEGAT